MLTNKFFAGIIILEINLGFIYEIKDFQPGLKRLALLLKQQEKRSLTKATLCSAIHPKSDFVRNSINILYQNLRNNIDTTSNCETALK